jgi:transcriptional regulator with XRE-family HTH domain
MPKITRERRIRELLQKDGLTKRQIASLADCSVPYVYKIQTKVAREKLLAAQEAPSEPPKAMVKVSDLMNRPYPVQKPKEPNDIHMLIMAILAFAVLWFLVVVIFSFKG